MSFGSRCNTASQHKYPQFDIHMYPEEHITLQTVNFAQQYVWNIYN